MGRASTSVSPKMAAKAASAEVITILSATLGLVLILRRYAPCESKDKRRVECTLPAAETRPKCRCRCSHGSMSSGGEVDVLFELGDADYGDRGPAVAGMGG
jgi:hypothetical protein